MGSLNTEIWGENIWLPLELSIFFYFSAWTEFEEKSDIFEEISFSNDLQADGRIILVEK